MILSSVGQVEERDLPDKIAEKLYRKSSGSYNEWTMRASEIVQLQRTRPFVPLRVYVSDGAWYDVPDPEMMMVTNTIVCVAQPPVAEGVPERAVYLDPIHITRIEPLDGRRPAASGTADTS